LFFLCYSSFQCFPGLSYFTNGKYLKYEKENEKFFDAFIESNGAKELFSVAKRFELSPLASIYRGVFSEVYGKNSSNLDAIVKNSRLMR